MRSSSGVHWRIILSFVVVHTGRCEGTDEIKAVEKKKFVRYWHFCTRNTLSLSCSVPSIFIHFVLCSVFLLNVHLKSGRCWSASPSIERFAPTLSPRRSRSALLLGETNERTRSKDFFFRRMSTHWPDRRHLFVHTGTRTWVTDADGGGAIDGYTLYSTIQACRRGGGEPSGRV